MSDFHNYVVGMSVILLAKCVVICIVDDYRRIRRHDIIVGINRDLTALQALVDNYGQNQQQNSHDSFNRYLLSVCLHIKRVAVEFKVGVAKSVIKTMYRWILISAKVIFLLSILTLLPLLFGILMDQLVMHPIHCFQNSWLESPQLNVHKMWVVGLVFTRILVK